jgi:predicted MPP superfamily phosphohydrolase
VERIELSHPLVSSGLEGTTILQVSDLHARRAMLTTARIRMILDALAATPADLIVLTGDLMDEPGHERGAMELLQALCAAWRPRAGVFGVFGNHDTPEFRRACIAELPTINWIGGRAMDVPIRGVALRLVGMDWPEDPLAIAITTKPSDALTIALAHHPTSLIGAAAIGLPILLAGHTHAGQIRLHPRLAPHTSSDLPMHLAAGMLRLNDTICCISRGLGDGVIEGLRINCPRQIPLYTLRRGPIPGEASAAVRQVVAW